VTNLYTKRTYVHGMQLMVYTVCITVFVQIGKFLAVLHWRYNTQDEP